MFGETACLGDRFKLPIDILHIALLPNADTAYEYDVMLPVNSENHAVVAELVLPIACQRPTQRKSVSFTVNG